MKRRTLLLALLGLAASYCSAPAKKEADVSRTPVSVRGWVQDIETPGKEGTFKVMDSGTERARKVALFKETTLFVEKAPYVTGAFGENGAFVLLDVPPGDCAIYFQRPGVPDVKLLLEHVPANADVVIPGLVIRNGAIDLLDPSRVQVRLSSESGTEKLLKGTVVVAGHTVPIREVPLNSLMDRREYPTPVAIRAKP